MYTPNVHHPKELPSVKPPSNKLLYIIIMLAAVVWVVSHCSCYTPAKAKRQGLRAMTQHPEEVLPTLRQLAPCITVTVDTFYTTVDTTITVDCPDTSAAQYFTVHDTLKHIERVEKPVSIPYRIQLPARTVVKYIKDSAEIMELNLRIARLITEREQAVKREQDTAAKLNKARSTRNWLWLIVLLCGIWITRKAWLPVVGRMVNPIK